MTYVPPSKSKIGSTRIGSDAGGLGGLLGQSGAPEAPQGLPEISDPDIDRCVQTAIFARTFSAAAVIASVGGKIFHRKVYGNAVHPPPVRRLPMDTVFDLGSLTQPLATSLGILSLAERNRIDLNADLRTTIPELRQSRLSGVTIDMLLDHTSGFPASRRMWQEVEELDEKRPLKERLVGKVAAAADMKAMLAEGRVMAEPGKRCEVSDLNMLALGWIIEGISGKPLDVFLQREVWHDLDVKDELFFVRLEDHRRRMKYGRRVFAATSECPWRKKLMVGEVSDENAWALGGLAGHAGLFGTVDGVWKVVHALWASHKGVGRAFLGGTVKRFWTRSRRLPGTTRTLGWDTATAHGSPSGKRFSLNTVGHLGSTGGSIWIDLSTDVIGVVLTNANHPSLEGKEDELAAFRPRIYDLIAKSGEAMGPPEEIKRGAAAFSDTVGTPKGKPPFGA